MNKKLPPTAYSATWKSPENTSALLSTLPQEGLSYEVYLPMAQDIHIDQQLYLVYLPINAELNGIEYLEDVENIRFCKVEVKQVLSRSANKARRILVSILELFALQDMPTAYNQWKMEEGTRDYEEILQFGDWIIIEKNVQSNWGATIIFYKNRLLAVHNWGQGREEWKAYNISLSEADFKKMGIQ